MMKSRLYSLNNVEGWFQNRRGSAAVWLIAAICFVVVFLGICFLLFRDTTSHQKPATVQTGFKSEIREPIKGNIASKETPAESEEPDKKAEVPVEKEVSGKLDQQLQEPLKVDPARIQDVHPDDPPGKGILSQDLKAQESDVPSEVPKASVAPESLPAEKPPLVAENAATADTNLQEKDEKPAAAAPAGNSSEKTPAPSSETPADVAPQPVEKDLKELVVRVLAGNVRKGPSVKETVVFRVARGDRVQVTGQKGNWYAVQRNGGESGWAHHTLFDAPSRPAAKVTPAISESGKKGVIKGIRTVVTDPNQAQIIFELNGYYPPEIMVIEGEAPRVVCDFFSVRLAPGVKKSFAVKTGVVNRIRVGVHKGEKPKIRVVLDLNAGQNYAVEQFFFEKENYYALMVNSPR